LLVGALLGSLYWISRRYASANGVSQPESQTPARTGFSANRDGAGWKLTWDSAAVGALKPTGATLSIQDEPASKTSPLPRPIFLAELSPTRAGGAFLGPGGGGGGFWPRGGRGGGGWWRG